jgi:hypothetical protein
MGCKGVGNEQPPSGVSRDRTRILSVTPRYRHPSIRLCRSVPWNTGVGDAALSGGTAIGDVSGSCLQLASELSALSQALWRCYTHPASAAPSLEPNTTGWRRGGDREAFTEVLPALAKPNAASSQPSRQSGPAERRARKTPPPSAIPAILSFPDGKRGSAGYFHGRGPGPHEIEGYQFN